MSWRDKERLVLVQKQLAIAVKALKEIRDDGNWRAASNALDEIERLKFVQEGRYDW